MFNEPKCESKDHKWKDAPIVGLKQNNFKDNNSHK